MPDEVVSNETEVAAQEAVTAPAEAAVVTPEVTPDEIIAESTDEIVAEIDAEVAAATGETVEQVEEDATGPVVETPVVEEDDSALLAAIKADPEKTLAEVKRLRREGAESRIAAKNSLSIEGADDEFIGAWQKLGQDYVNGDPEALAVFAELAGAPAPAETPAAPAELDQAQIEANIVKNITEFAQRQAAETAAQAQAAVLFTEIKELGYDPEATAESNPEAYAAHQLLWGFVKAQPEGQRDYKTAHEAVTEYNKAVLAKGLADLKTASDSVPPVTAGAGATSAEQDSEEAGLDAEERTRRFYQRRNASPLS